MHTQFSAINRIFLFYYQMKMPRQTVPQPPDWRGNVVFAVDAVILNNSLHNFLSREHCCPKNIVFELLQFIFRYFDIIIVAVQAGTAVDISHVLTGNTHKNLIHIDMQFFPDIGNLRFENTNHAQNVFHFAVLYPLRRRFLKIKNVHISCGIFSSHYGNNFCCTQVYCNNI